MFWFFGREAWGILVPATPALEGESWPLDHQGSPRGEFFAYYVVKGAKM